MCGYVPRAKLVPQNPLLGKDPRAISPKDYSYTACPFCKGTELHRIYPKDGELAAVVTCLSQNCGKCWQENYVLSFVYLLGT